MARMTCNVYVLTEEGEALLLEAGSTPPAWALPQLGEHTLDDSVDEDERDEPDSSEEDSDEPEDIDDSVDEPGPQIPPVKGPGSSAKAWAAYAFAHGYEVDKDAKATEIRAALAEAGVPVE